MPMPTMIAQRYTKIKQSLNNSLFRNSLFLILSRILNVGAGFLFWVIAAKLYSVEDVGRATALISSLGLIMLLSRMGFDFSLIRYISLTDRKQVFSTSLSITTILTTVISVVFIMIDSILPSPMITDIGQAALFVLVAILNSMTLITGNMFWALRSTHYYFLQNVILSLRMLLLFPLLFMHSFGIFLALGLCYILASIFALYLLKQKGCNLSLSVDRPFIKNSFRFSFGNYLSNNLFEAPALLLPILVLHLLGEGPAAYYYIGFMLGNLTIIIPSALSTSLFVEGSHEQPLKENLFKTVSAAYFSLVPCVILILLLGKSILGFIDPQYVPAFNLLRLVALSSFFHVPLLVYIAVQNVKMQVKANVKINLLRFILLLTFSYLFIQKYNIEGVGYAFLLTYSILTGVISIRMWKERAGKLNAIKQKIKTIFRTKNLHIFSEKVLAYLLITLALVGMIGPILFKKFNLSLLGSYLGIPMILAPVTWVKVKNNQARIFVFKINFFYLLSTIYLICYALTILVLDHYVVRTVPYYFFIAFMGTCILCQILNARDLSPMARFVILLEIAFLVLNIVWGVTLKYYFFIGRTDTMVHSMLTQHVIDTGHIGGAFDIYEAFPLWHILCTIIHQICGFTGPAYKVMFLVNGLVYAFLVILVYLAVEKLLNSDKVALLAALFTCLNPDVLFYGMYSIPRSAVFFLEVLLILMLLKKKNPTVVALTIFVSFSIVMYHTASMPFVVIILFTIYTLQRAFKLEKNKYFVNFNYLLLVIVITITYWFYFGGEVFRALFKNIFTPAKIGTITKAVVNTPLNELFNYLQYSPLLFFIICGVLWIVPSKRSSLMTKVFFVAALGLTFVTLPGPTLLINKLAGNFNLNRFGEYSFFFICMAAATGLYAVYIKARQQHRGAIVVLFTLMAFLSVSNDFTASDNPLVKRPFYTYYFTENETTAIQRLGGFAKGYVMADFPSKRFLDCTDHFEKSHIMEAGGLPPKILTNSKDDLLLIRKEELNNRPLKLFTSEEGKFDLDPSLAASQDYFAKDLPLWKDLEKLNQVYDSGAVTALN